MHVFVLRSSAANIERVWTFRMFEARRCMWNAKAPGQRLPRLMWASDVAVAAAAKPADHFEMFRWK